MAAGYGRGTIFSAADFNAENVAIALSSAMKGIGTDEDVIIDVLTSHNNAQRQIVKKKYKTLFGRILAEDLKAELGGHFEEVCLALLAPLSEYVIDCLYWACKGFKVDEGCIVEILCSLEDMELRYISSAFQEKYAQDLEIVLQSCLKDEMMKICSSLLPTNRDDSINTTVNADEALAQMEAQKLSDQGQANALGIDKEMLLDIISKRSKLQVRATMDAYEKIAGQTLQNAIKTKQNPGLATALLSIVQCIENRPAFYARKLSDALSGPSTDDKTIIRILVSRSEIDLADIRDWYHIKFNDDLNDAIYEDTSGDYRKILLKLVNPV